MQLKRTKATLITIILLAFSGILFAQTSPLTKVDSTEGCGNTSILFPVHVEDLMNIDSFSLVLSFNPSVLVYESYSYLNSSLEILDGMTGDFSILAAGDKVQITWHRDEPADLPDDTLLILSFKGLTGSTALTWDVDTQGACFYHCADGTYLTTDFVNGYVKVDPPLHLLLNELNATCKGKCDANYMATVTGGTKPYLYLWNNKPGKFDSIQINLCDSLNLIQIIDSKGCQLDSTYNIEGLPGPVIDLVTECDGVEVQDSLYRENPILTFRIETDDAVKPPFEWDFGDGIKATTNDPTITHTYSTANDPKIKEYLLTLRVVNSNDCDSLYTFTIYIKDDSIVKINNVMVPEGSEKNRVFLIADKNDPDWIPLIHQFRHIEVIIFDRWGRKVYANNDYQCDWRADGLPAGVYFYTVKIVGYFNTSKHKGSLTIIR